MPYLKLKKYLLLLLLLILLAPSLAASAEQFYQVKYVGGRQPGVLIGSEGEKLGTATYWNTRDDFVAELVFDEMITLLEAQVFVGRDEPIDTEELDVDYYKNGKPVPGKFPCVREINLMDQTFTLTCSLEQEMALAWGQDREYWAAVHGDLIDNSFWLVPVDESGENTSYVSYPGLKHGGYFDILLTHPARGHFIDSPVFGLNYQTPTQWGLTEISGGFDYFPGEEADFWVGQVYLGYALADHKISPMDLFPGFDTFLEKDPETDEVITPVTNPVINMAVFLQSLDADGEPKQGISITEPVVACLDAAYAELYYEDEDVDFFNGDEVDALIYQTMVHCDGVEGVTLVKVSPEDAKANLDKSLDTTMFRKNISKTPDLSSSKSKLNIMPVWFPALRANNEPTVVEYYDESGTLIRSTEEAKPIIVAYTDAVPETGMEDVFVAISRDDGNTFKRKNVARGADRSSFDVTVTEWNEDYTEILDQWEEPYYGEAKKPVFQVKGNKILVAWTSKYCHGGRPAYAIDIEPETDDYIYDNDYYTEDIWGVAGPQRSVDYTDQGFPDVGEVPYSCVWTARGVIATQADVDAGLGDFVGDIVWFKAERLTSGRRDANQVFMGAADDAGFAIAWQEDPEGLRPGQAKGPGPGWGGATTNHKTDIWYSYITWDDFAEVDENFVSGGDPQHELDMEGRPKALVPMSLPVRVTDNDVVNSDNIMATTSDFETWTPYTKDVEGEGDGEGTHAYGYMIDGLCEGWYEKVNQQGETKQVCITDDGRLLDGNTGASRPNLFLQKYTKSDGTVSAWAIFAYDESKGLGAGPPEEPGIPNEGEADYLPEEGKNSLYHSFDFQKPDLVSAGTIINLPQKAITVDETNFTYTVDANISYVVDEAGNEILVPQPVLDANGDPTGEVADQVHINYENARRPRFIMQGKKAAVDSESNTIMMILYKEGEEGSGRPSDIMLRRVVVPDGQTGNPYRPENIVCNTWESAENGQTVCVDGAQNMSTVLPTVTTESQGEPTAEDPYGAVKVVQWVQTEETLAWPSGVNRFEDARAHRGAIMGDFVVMGYSYTPNWAAFRNGNDKYDFFLRRSFDGGQTWTTDPNGSGVTNCDTYTDPVSKEKTEVCTTFGPGEFEQARNMSQLANNKSSVIEPRIVKAPGTITDPETGLWTGIPEDKNRFGMYYVSYGTATNEKKVFDEEIGKWVKPEAAPMDLFYSFSLDLGETHVEIAWDVNPDSEGNYAGETVYRWDYLAKGPQEQGEAQLRMTPDGSRFYATWVQEGYDKKCNYGSDIWFRRIMSPEFPVNVATAVADPVIVAAE